MDSQNLRQKITSKIFPKRFGIIWKVSLQGYVSYTKVWYTIIGVMAVMALLATTILAPLVFIFPILVSQIPPIDFQGIIANDPGAINSLMNNITADPLIWIGVILISGLAFAVTSIYIGAIQKYAHIRGTMEDIFKDLIRNDVLWLVVVGILMFFIITIPLSLGLLLFSQLSEFVISQQPEFINFLNSIRALTLTGMLFILICPFFLATASIVVGNKKLSGTSGAIILYKRNFFASIGTFILALTPVFILGFIFFVIDTITTLIGSTTLSEQQILTSDPLTVANYFLNQYITILSTFAGSFVGFPLLVITMSVLYKNIQEKPEIITETQIKNSSNT